MALKMAQLHGELLEHFVTCDGKICMLLAQHTHPYLIWCFKGPHLARDERRAVVCVGCCRVCACVVLQLDAGCCVFYIGFQVFHIFYVIPSFKHPFLFLHLVCFNTSVYRCSTAKVVKSSQVARADHV